MVFKDNTDPMVRQLVLEIIGDISAKANDLDVAISEVNGDIHPYYIRWLEGVQSKLNRIDKDNLDTFPHA